MDLGTASVSGAQSDARMVRNSKASGKGVIVGSGFEKRR